MCSSKGWMSGRSEWGVPGHASTELCNEGGFHVHPVPLDGSMQLGAGASLGATPKQGTSPDAPSAPRVPAAVRGFGVDKRQSYLNSWRGSGLTAWAGVSDSSDDAGVGESSHSLFTAWGGSLCSIRSLVVRELKASAVPRTAGLSTSGKPEAVAAEAATEMYTVAWQTQSPLETALPHPGGVLSAEPGAWTAWGTGTSMQSRNIWKGFSAGHGPFSPPLWSSMRVLCAFQALLVASVPRMGQESPMSVVACTQGEPGLSAAGPGVVARAAGAGGAAQGGALQPSSSALLAGSHAASRLLSSLSLDQPHDFQA